MPLIAPHGGKLVNRVLEGQAGADAQRAAETLPSITLSTREAFDLEMIAIGAFSPLVGFMGQKDFASGILSLAGDACGEVEELGYRFQIRRCAGAGGDAFGDGGEGRDAGLAHFGGQV